MFDAFVFAQRNGIILRPQIQRDLQALAQSSDAGMAGCGGVGVPLIPAYVAFARQMPLGKFCIH